MSLKPSCNRTGPDPLAEVVFGTTSPGSFLLLICVRPGHHPKCKPSWTGLHVLILGWFCAFQPLTHPPTAVPSASLPSVSSAIPIQLYSPRPLTHLFVTECSLHFLTFTQTQLFPQGKRLQRELALSPGPQGSKSWKAGGVSSQPPLLLRVFSLALAWETPSFSEALVVLSHPPLSSLGTCANQICCKCGCFPSLSKGEYKMFQYMYIAYILKQETTSGILGKINY